MAGVSVHETFETAVDGIFDVVVAGGGASGLIAAVAAARLGARTLLLERQGCLGGTATTAYVAQYVGFYNGDTQAVWGIPHELTRRIVDAGGALQVGSSRAKTQHPPPNDRWVCASLDPTYFD